MRLLHQSPVTTDQNSPTVRPRVTAPFHGRLNVVYRRRSVAISRILTGDTRDTTGRWRLEGFREAMSEAGLSLEQLNRICGGGWLQHDGYTAANEMLSDPTTRPTAVFSSNYLLNLGMFQFCTERSLNIPSDLSTVTFGDSRHYPYYGSGLTAIRFPVENIASSITNLFLSRIGNVEVPASRTAKHACELILRGFVTRITL